jgi:hypothetical protein
MEGPQASGNITGVIAGIIICWPHRLCFVAYQLYRFNRLRRKIFAGYTVRSFQKGPGNEIQEAAAAAIKQFAFIDGSKQAAGGASYGGHLALTGWRQQLHIINALFSHAGLVNSEAQWGTSDGIYSRER